MTRKGAQYLYFRPVCIDLRCNEVKKTLRVRAGKHSRGNKKREAEPASRAEKKLR
jgi:hypothetical protein